MNLRRLAEQFGQHLDHQLSLFRLPTPPARPAPQHVVLDGQVIPYTLNQGRQRRRLTLTIDERGLRVGAPHSLARAEIDAFIHQHRAWIVQKLADLATAARPRHVSVRDGLRLPLLGDEIDVRVHPGANRSRWIATTLLLEARPAADLNLLAQRALQKRALSHFETRLAHFAPQLGVSVPRVGLSSARTRWGSCSRHSGIRLNWRLIHLPPHLGDYVAVHELAHLHEMNHGPRFWAWVERAYPDWQAARTELKHAANQLPIL
jgi:predicted metal-dependent hydrolase